MGKWHPLIKTKFVETTPGPLSSISIPVKDYVGHI